MVRILRIKRSFSNNKHNNPWLRAMAFSKKLHAHFIDIQCDECEVDGYLAAAFAKLFDLACPQIVVYLGNYSTCNGSVRGFIDKYLSTFDFSNKITVIAS